jgi:outer membrane protein W
MCIRQTISQGVTAFSKKVSVLTLSLLVSALVLSVAVTGRAQGEEDLPFPIQHQAGIRIGGWANSGDTPLESFEDDGFSVITDINDGSLYLEGYFGYRLTPAVVGEFSVGFASRGDVISEDGFIQDVGSLNIYPILLQLKIYTPTSIADKVHFYFSGGGGIYYARNSVTISNEIYYTQYREKSVTDFSYVVGAGIDWVLTSQLGLGLNVKYMPVKFNKEMLGIRDYSALTITVGVSYLYASKKK